MTETVEPSDEQVIAIAKLYGNYIEGHGWTGFGPSPEAISDALTRSDPAVRDRVTDEARREHERSAALAGETAAFAYSKTGGGPMGVFLEGLLAYRAALRTSPPELASGLEDD